MRIKLTNCDKYAIIDEEVWDSLKEYTWKGVQSHGQIKYVGKVGKADVRLHNLLLPNPTPETHVVDHINGDGLDNRLSNLRLIKKEQNAWNRKPYKARKYKGTAKISGAKEGQKQYQARIRKEGKGMYIGSFYTEEEAARAYDIKARELFGELACLNFPEVSNSLIVWETK
jgi:hypothetical protein